MRDVADVRAHDAEGRRGTLQSEDRTGIRSRTPSFVSRTDGRPVRIWADGGAKWPRCRPETNTRRQRPARSASNNGSYDIFNSLQPQNRKCPICLSVSPRSGRRAPIQLRRWMAGERNLCAARCRRRPKPM